MSQAAKSPPRLLGPMAFWSEATILVALACDFVIAAAPNVERLHALRSAQDSAGQDAIAARERRRKENGIVLDARRCFAETGRFTTADRCPNRPYVRAVTANGSLPEIGKNPAAVADWNDATTWCADATHASLRLELSAPAELTALRMTYSDIDPKGNGVARIVQAHVEWESGSTDVSFPGGTTLTQRTAQVDLPEVTTRSLQVSVVSHAALAEIAARVVCIATVAPIGRAAAFGSNQLGFGLLGVKETLPAESPLAGTDLADPSLPASDRGFTDQDGWGWSNRCWINIGLGNWGWAKAECDEGLTHPRTQRASLLYNEGLIERQAGHLAQARRYFGESLAARQNAEVRSALESVGGSAGIGPVGRPPTSPTARPLPALPAPSSSSADPGY